MGQAIGPSWKALQGDIHHPLPLEDDLSSGAKVLRDRGSHGSPNRFCFHFFFYIYKK